MRTQHLHDTTDLYAGIASGDLPAVSWVKPSGLVDGHPASSKLDLFEGFVKKIVDGVTANPALAKNTAIFVTFDEGGGSYDSGYVQQLDFFGDGTRIPMIVVSTIQPGRAHHSLIHRPRLDLEVHRGQLGLEPDHDPQPGQFAESDLHGCQPLRADESAGDRRPDGHVQLRRAASVSLADIGATKGAYNDDFNACKGFCGRTDGGRDLWGGGRQAGATMLTLTDPTTESDVTVTFTATATESFVIVEGYQVPDIETVTNNMVTLSGGGPNLLGSTWQSRFAALGSNSFTFNDGTPVPALGFAAQNPPDMDTFYQMFATVPGETTLTASITRTTLWSSALRLRFSSRRPAAFRKPRPGPCCFSASPVSALPAIAPAAPRSRSRNLASVSIGRPHVGDLEPHLSTTIRNP